MATIRHALPAPSRARIYLASGAWYVQEQVRLRDGSFRDAAAPVALTVVSAPGAEVALSGTTLTLKSGLAVQTQPHAATIQWALPLASLPGLSLTVGKQHEITVTADSIPTTINSYLGAVLCAPSGAYDAAAETISAISLGFGNSSVASTRYAMLTSNWANLIADASIVSSQMCYEEGSAQCDIRGLSASSVVQKSHQTTDSRTATHLYIVGFSQTANLLADASFTNPVITISYGV